MYANPDPCKFGSSRSQRVGAWGSLSNKTPGKAEAADPIKALELVCTLESSAEFKKIQMPRSEPRDSEVIGKDSQRFLGCFEKNASAQATS